MGCSSSKEVGSGPPPVPQPLNQPRAQPETQLKDNAQNSVTPLKTNRPARGEGNYDSVRISDLPENERPAGVRVGRDTLHRWKDDPKPPWQAPPPGTTSDLSGQPANWPKIIQMAGYPLVIFIVATTRWSPASGEVPCWTYISSGLDAVNQPEIVLTLGQRKHEDIEDWSRMPLEYVRLLYLAALEDGEHVHAGQMVEVYFQDPVQVKIGNKFYQSQLQFWEDWHNMGLLIHAEHHGDAADLPPLPYPRHHIMALTQNEATVAKEFGCHRVLSWLMVSTSWFPIPGWIDRDRRGVMQMSDCAGSILVTTQALKRGRIYGLSVIYAENGDVVMRIPEEESQKAAFLAHVRATRPEEAVSLESFIPSDADSLLAWKTGNTAPMILRKSMEAQKCLSTAFISFGQHREQDSCIMVEDGVGLIIRQESWVRLLAAMKQVQNFDLPIFDKTDQKMVTFRLRWRREGVVEPQQLKWHNGVGEQ